MQKNSWKRSLLLERMAFERVAGTYQNYEENTYDRQSACYQAVLIFQIQLKRDVF